MLGLRAPLPPGLRDNFLLLAALVALQYLLGMATLVLDAPNLGFIHELNAVLLLTAAICARHGLRGALSGRKLPFTPTCRRRIDMSEALNTAEKLFHAQGGLDPVTAARHIATAIDGADDGELFLEYRESESISLDDGRIRAASFDTRRGFGLRAVLGEASYYAHAGEIVGRKPSPAPRKPSKPPARRNSPSPPPAPPPAMPRFMPGSTRWPKCPSPPAPPCCRRSTPLPAPPIPRVIQVMASISGEWQVVEIIRADGSRTADLRPLVRLNVSVVLEQNGRRESGSHGAGGRTSYAPLIDPNYWQGAIHEAIRQASVNLEAIAAPAGEMPVVLGAGWPGILLHEAIGHGLEGDFNRKQTSAFAGLMGSRIASKGVTVVDDGTLPDRRGVADHRR